MSSDNDRLRDETLAKLRAMWSKDPTKVQRLARLELDRRAPRRAATEEVLASASRQALRVAALTKLAILKAKAPEKYARLMFLEAKRRGLKPGD